jgi:hypothetical protein
VTRLTGRHAACVEVQTAKLCDVRSPSCEDHAFFEHPEKVIHCVPEGFGKITHATSRPSLLPECARHLLGAGRIALVVGSTAKLRIAYRRSARPRMPYSKIRQIKPILTMFYDPVSPKIQIITETTQTNLVYSPSTLRIINQRRINGENSYIFANTGKTAIS